jgi:hypothetical protein
MDFHTEIKIFRYPLSLIIVKFGLKYIYTELRDIKKIVSEYL